MKSKYISPSVEVVRLSKPLSILVDASLAKFGIDEFEQLDGGATVDSE